MELQREAQERELSRHFLFPDEGVPPPHRKGIAPGDAAALRWKEGWMLVASLGFAIRWMSGRSYGKLTDLLRTPRRLTEHLTHAIASRHAMRT